MQAVGLAHGITRRKRRDDRRRTVMELLRQDKTNDEIAAATGVSEKTIREDIEAIRAKQNQLKPAQEARRRQNLQRWRCWHELSDEGWTVEEIAQVDDVTAKTVERRLKELAEARDAAQD